MIRRYQLPEEKERPFQHKEKFMKDKHKRYVRLESDCGGTLGYWDNKCVPMYSLSMEFKGTELCCQLLRQEEKKGKKKRPHDLLFSLGIGLAAFALLYLILGGAIGLPDQISLFVSVLVGLVVLVGMLVIYLMEYRGFYRLLDAYLQKTLHAGPVKK